MKAKRGGQLFVPGDTEKIPLEKWMASVYKVLGTRPTLFQSGPSAKIPEQVGKSAAKQRRTEKMQKTTE